MTTSLPDTTSALGYGLRLGYCAARLPNPDGTMGVIATIQPALGLATDATTGARLSSATSGRTLLADAIVRRLDTARGSLPDSKVPTTMGNYGLDILDAVGADFTAQDAGQLGAQIDGQIKQDQRVTSSATVATLAGGLLVIAISLNDGAGPFSMTLTVNTLTQNLQVLSAP